MQQLFQQEPKVYCYYIRTDVYIEFQKCTVTQHDEEAWVSVQALHAYKLKLCHNNTRTLTQNSVFNP